MQRSVANERRGRAGRRRNDVARKRQLVDQEGVLLVRRIGLRQAQAGVVLPLATPDVAAQTDGRLVEGQVLLALVVAEADERADADSRPAARPLVGTEIAEREVRRNQRAPEAIVERELAITRLLRLA
jgi:hypothetical protein